MIQTKQIDGDVAVGRHVSIGGDVTIQGNEHIKQNLRVDGILTANKIKGPEKGVFSSIQELKSAFPHPSPGDWALVTIEGSVSSEYLGQLFLAEDGEWVGKFDENDFPILTGSTHQNSGSGGSGSGVYVITSTSKTPPSDYNVYSALRSDKQFLRKDKADTAKERITFEQGLTALQEAQLAQGATFGAFNAGQLVGTGAHIDGDGNAEVESLRVRSTMEVTKLVVNEQAVQQGDTLFSEGAEVVAVELVDAARRLYRVHLKPRYEGDALPFVEGDVLRGVFNSLAGRAAGLSTVEGDGLFTSWMRVEGLNSNAHSVEVVLYPDDETPAGRNFAPVVLMELARWGNADVVNHRDRGQLFYISSRDGRLAKLSGVTKPIIDISNLTATFGTLPDEVVRYLGAGVEKDRDYVYLKGAVVEDLVHIDRQLGRPRSEVVWRGVWTEGAAYYDGTASVDGCWEQSKVSYQGCQYLCTKAGTATADNAPRYGNTAWVMVEGNPEFRIDFEEGEQFYDFDTFRAPLTLRATLHHQDVTAAVSEVVWTRHTEDSLGEPRTTSDALWAKRVAEQIYRKERDAKRMVLTMADLDWSEQDRPRLLRFTATAGLGDYTASRSFETEV